MTWRILVANPRIVHVIGGILRCPFGCHDVVLHRLEVAGGIAEDVDEPLAINEGVVFELDLEIDEQVIPPSFTALICGISEVSDQSHVLLVEVCQAMVVKQAVDFIEHVIPFFVPIADTGRVLTFALCAKTSQASCTFPQVSSIAACIA